MKTTDDPYGDFKLYHRATLINKRGRVSAMCFKRPHAINLKQALWTIRDEAVTCPKCLLLMHAKEKPDA